MYEITPAKKRIGTVLKILVLFLLLVAAFAGYARYFITHRVDGNAINENFSVFETRLQNIENSLPLHEKRIKDLEETASKTATLPANVIAPTNTETAAAPATTPPVSDERFATLEKEIMSLKASSPFKDKNGISKSIRLLSAFHRLSDKVIGGKPFSAEMSSFENLANSDESSGSPLATLAPYAESGIPTFATLLVSFDQSVESMNTTLSLPPANATFWQRFVYNISHLVSVRRIDDAQTGSSAGAIVGRAQAYLEREEIEAAIAELKSLPDNLRANFTAWLDDAEMVTEAPSLIDQIEEQTLRKAFLVEDAQTSDKQSEAPVSHKSETPAEAPADNSSPAQKQ